MPELTERTHRRKVAQKIIGNDNFILIVVMLALIGGLSFATNGLNLVRNNISNVLLQSAIRGVASMGQAFVILTAGIDLSVASVGLMSSTLAASLMTSSPDLNIIGHPMSLYAVIPIILLVGLGWGAVNGTLISFIGAPALIVTLGMQQIVYGVAFQISQGKAIFQLPENLVFLGAGNIAGVPTAGVIFIVVAVIAYLFSNHSTFGKSVYGSGANPVTAWLSGIKVKNIKFTVYCISGLLAGLAGLIMTARSMSASMATLRGLEMDTIAAVCIGGISLMGGRGTIIGAIIGVIIVGIINNGMSILGANYGMQQLTKGAIIFAAVAIDYIRRNRNR